MTMLGRAITLYCDLVAKAAIDGISRAQGQAGVDLGAAEKPIIEELPAEKTEWEGFEPLPGPVGAPDDLKKLHGVSPAIEKQLNDLGFFHYSQVAASAPRTRIISARRWACPAASRPGSRKRRRFRPRRSNPWPRSVRASSRSCARRPASA